MLLIGQVYPDARIVVAAATRGQAWRNWRKLESELKEPVGLAVSGVRREGRRWLVATFQSVPRKMAGKFDILLLPHGEDSTGERAAEMVAQMGFRRRYAFVRPQRRADRLVQIWLEQMAGEVIHRLKWPRVPVRVLILRTPGCKVGSYKTPLERKRALYWHNEVRNKHVAAVADAVVSGDRMALQALGMRNRDIRSVLGCARNKVAVLAESPEHGRELLSLMPGWWMLDMVGDGGCKSDQDDGNDRLPAVVTAVYAAKKGTRADIVIRATGTEWALRMKGFPRKENKHTPGELLVIDFQDDFDTGASNDARRRVQEYQRQGMEVMGINNGPE
jgi:hypothetical protein